MSNQISYSKYSCQVLPYFRERISNTESTDDLKECSVYTYQEFFDAVVAGKLESR